MNRFLALLPRPATILMVLILGLFIGRCFTPVEEVAMTASPGHGEEAAQEVEAPEVWTCSMHPSVQAPTAGDCPICGMDLIPLEQDSSSTADGPRTLRLPEGEKAIAGIQTTPVVRQEVAHTVRLVGKLAVDETALAILSAWVGGRLDRLYVDYTGLKVRAGDHMAEIYSPQLFHAQEELIVAVESAKRFAAQSDESLVKISHSTVVAARKKLALYGLTEEQMQEIVDKGEPSEQITLNAPMGGTVIHRNAVEGSYVKEGDALYTIADLDSLWLELDAYESDMPWIRYGQEVLFEVDAWPGETFRGSISFIDPVLNPLTRTVHLRVDVDNSEGKFRPEMFARARVQTMIVGTGQPAPVDLTGKWMCPMHPEVLADGPEECSICGMDLETTESLGYTQPEATAGAPLLIPASAPLLTGDRAVVFVQVPDTELHGADIFEARDIILGPRAGDFFVVREGLEEDELVVSRGGFVIDSELQLRGKPSMMAPQGGGGGGHEGHGGRQGMGNLPEMEQEPATAEFRAAIGQLLIGVAELGEALASDDFEASSAAVGHLQARLAGAEDQAMPSATDLLESIRSAATEVTGSTEIEDLRNAFFGLQGPVITLAGRFGYAGLDREMSVFHCPMAMDDGADWIDFHGDGVRNPYYGASMLKCGSETRTIPGFQQK
ncbi:MAG: efflux RND transporter periplasmic adaptor subunit [Planctomycetota bacterium]|jgi:Cu(I)/Ag(I) efflux system membrane fusion protein